MVACFLRFWRSHKIAILSLPADNKISPSKEQDKAVTALSWAYNQDPSQKGKSNSLTVYETLSSETSPKFPNNGLSLHDTGEYTNQFRLCFYLHHCTHRTQSWPTDPHKNESMHISSPDYFLQKLIFLKSLNRARSIYSLAHETCSDFQRRP